MKKLFLLPLAALVLGSCATIFTKSSYPLTFTTNPAGAEITIVNRAGSTVYSGVTPSTVKLKSAAGYMKREEYAVTLKCAGHAPQTIPVLCNLDGWYVGNLLLGGIIGMLIVDPASGAMYRIPDENIHTELRPVASTARELQILNIAQIPDDVQLVRIK